MSEEKTVKLETQMHGSCILSLAHKTASKALISYLGSGASNQGDINKVYTEAFDTVVKNHIKSGEKMSPGSSSAAGIL